jgi:Ca-activated chloride channel family protein
MILDFAHPHFAEPHWLWLAVLGPLATLVLLAWSAYARRKQIAQFISRDSLATPHGDALDAGAGPIEAGRGLAQRPPQSLAATTIEGVPHPQLPSSHSPRRRFCKNILLLLAIIGMGIALARPQWGEQAELAYVLGDDILFLLDCSRSMLAADVRPSRLQRAKLAILDCVQQHGRGRVGLVAFAGQAFLQCPLTFDYDAFGDALMAIDDNTIPVLGTDMGQALDEGFFAMEKNDRRKIMVLLTDGEDLEKTGINTAQQLASQGVVVFTVGVGTASGSAIQITTPQGITGLLRDQKGGLVQSRLDEATLRAIAETTHGRYQPLGTLGEGMRMVRQAIENTSDLQNVRPQRKLGVDRFHFPVAFVVILLVLESLVGTRTKKAKTMHLDNAKIQSGEKPPTSKTSHHGPTGKPVFSLVCQPSMTALAVATLVLSPSVWSATDEPADTLSPRALYNEGTRLLKEGNLPEADAALISAAARQLPAIQEPALYNLGHVRFQQGKKALKDGPDFNAIRNREAGVSVQTQKLIQDADVAMAAQRIETIVSLYRQGRVARKQLRLVSEQVKTALELYRTVLLRWDRASGDFKSAYELSNADRDAQWNAGFVDRQIAELVEQIRRMEQSMQSLKGQQQQLQQRMNDMKKLLPKEEQNGDEEDEEEEDQGKQPKPGEQEKPGREGREKLMTREEAARLLESFKLDSNRKLPMGMERSGNIRDRQGRTW